MTLDIVSLVILLLDTGATIALIWILIVRARKAAPHTDTAAEERRVLREGQRTLLERIERLRERPTVISYIVYDHTRNRIVGDASGVAKKDGDVATLRPIGIDPKYAGERVRLLAILSDGEEAKIF